MEEQARKIFEFAKKLGIRAITTESDRCDRYDREAGERVRHRWSAFTIIPRQPNNPNYRVWDP